MTLAHLHKNVLNLNMLNLQDNLYCSINTLKVSINRIIEFIVIFEVIEKYYCRRFFLFFVGCICNICYLCLVLRDGFWF